jgi:hypothetical protein
MSNVAFCELNTGVHQAATRQERAQARAERETLLSLLQGLDEADADAALGRSGWLDLVPGEDDEWTCAPKAVRAVATVAWAEHPVPLLSRLAAGLLAGPLGLGPDRDLTVATDAVRYTDAVRATQWTPRADGVLLGPLEGRLYLAPAAVIDRPQPRGHPGDDALARPGTTAVTVPADALVPVCDDPDVLARYEARLALLLAADALGAAERGLELADAHLREHGAAGSGRSDRPGLRHRLVEMSLALTVTGESVAHAIRQSASAESELAAWSAKSIAGRRCVWLIEQALEMHDGFDVGADRGLRQSLHRAQRTRHLLGGGQRAAAEVLARYRARRRPAAIGGLSSAAADRSAPSPGRPEARRPAGPRRTG